MMKQLSSISTSLSRSAAGIEPGNHRLAAQCTTIQLTGLPANCANIFMIKRIGLTALIITDAQRCFVSHMMFVCFWFMLLGLHVVPSITPSDIFPLPVSVWLGLNGRLVQHSHDEFASGSSPKRQPTNKKFVY